jgi:hypothetical protein
MNRPRKTLHEYKSLSRQVISMIRRGFRTGGKPSTARCAAALLCMLACACPRARAQTATLQADAAVTTAHPATNYGTLSNLYVSSTSTVLLLFDLGTLAPGITSSQVSRATLRLYVNRISTPGVVTLAPVNSAWAESGVTAQTAPSIGNATEVFALTDEGQFVTADVTALVQGWIANPSGNFGIALTASSADAVFDSKENDTTAHHATLEIATAAGAVGPQGPAGNTGATGPAGPQGIAGPQGPKGDTGAAGTAGAQGIAGSKGDTGATGPQGPKGDTGAAGPKGAQGPTGEQGATGAQGAAGRDGAQGPAGSTGPAGNAGPVGPQGVPGPAGLTWQGSYAAFVNYAANDAVTWQGQTWISLHATNHGNTPDQSPFDWALLAAQGAAGAQGPQGAAGPQGVAGPQGPKGDTGGPGQTGSQGPAGIPGPPVHFLGAWSVAAAYNTGDAVSYNGSSYIATAAVSGNTPDSSSIWSLLARQGDAGPAGATGPAGSNGIPGSNGAAGPQGPAGPAGIHWQGTYNHGGGYVSGDAVAFNGSSYLSVTTPNIGITPGTDTSFWQVLAAAGGPGIAGSNGAQGAQGNDGAAASIQIGTTATGPAGTAAMVQNVGSPNAAILNFTVPQGAAGPAGAPGFVYQGTWMRGTGYSNHDVVFRAGSSYVSQENNNLADPQVSLENNSGEWALLAMQGSDGATGPAGVAGPAGATPTVAVHATFTGAAGTAATVTNIGTDTAVLLDFTIPQGAGGSGAGGGVYTTVHTVAPASDGLQIYSPLADGHGAAEAFNLDAYLPAACNISSVQVYNASGTDATLEIHIGTPGAMNVTAAGTCTVRAGGATNCPGPGLLGSNNFLSFGITGSSASSSYLYTQFSCN